MMDVLPAPVAPTMATFSPSAIWNETSFSTQLPGSYANQTLRNSISPRMRLRLDGAASSRTTGRSSRIWKIRSERAREQEGLLGDEADLFAQLGQTHVADVHSVQQNLTRGRVRQPGDQ